MNIRSLFKNAGIVTFGALGSRLLGLAREAVIANRFGQSGQTDSIKVGSYIPITLSNMLVSGIVAAVFIPLFTRMVEEDKKEELREIIIVTINQFVLLMVGVSLLLYFLAPWVLKIQVPGWEGERLQDGIQVFRIALPSILFLGLAALSSGILNAIKIFSIPTLGGIVFNATIVVMTLLFARQWGIKVVPIALVLGAIGQFLIQYIWVVGFKLGYHYKPLLYHSKMKELYALIIPVLIGSGINYLAPIVNNMIGSQLSGGYISALDNAFKISQLPISIFALAVSAVVFPNLAEHVAKMETEKVQENIQWALKFVLMIMLPATLGLVAISQPTVQLILQHGDFTAADTAITFPAVQLYCIALIPWSITAILVKILYSCKDTVTPVFVAIATVAVLVLSNILLLGPLGHYGLALGSAISGVFNALFLWIIICKRYPQYLIVSPLRKTGLTCLTGSLIMYGCILLLNKWFIGFLSMNSTWSLLFLIGILICIGCGVYGAFMYYFDKPDLKEVMGL